jgi:hypothetical protein
VNVSSENYVLNILQESSEVLMELEGLPNALYRTSARC